MEEEIALYLDEAKSLMNKAIAHFKQVILKIRAGKAMPNMLDGLMVDYYGSATPLSQVSSISTPDARTLFIKPWEKGLISEIEKTINKSDLGINPQNDGEQVILNIPPLTEDRRKDLVKQARNEGETAKISIRNIRKDSNEQLKKLQKDGAPEDSIKSAEDEVQKMTNDFSAKVDELLKTKEAEIMTV